MVAQFILHLEKLFKRSMKISIIIPVVNEASYIGRLLDRLLVEQQSTTPGFSILEIIVVDGASEDASVEIAKSKGAKIEHSSIRRRSIQLNLGAQSAQGDILYFVHSDTLPPLGFVKDIEDSISAGYRMGCYRFQFDSDKWYLRINSFFTRFDFPWCRGGDQTLFVFKQDFMALGMFNEECLIMEEYEYLKKARKLYKFKIIPRDVMVSARKYDRNSWWTVQQANRKVFQGWSSGVEQSKLLEFYRNALR